MKNIVLTLKCKKNNEKPDVDICFKKRSDNSRNIARSELISIEFIFSN